MNDVNFVDMPVSTQVVPLTRLAARFNLTERTMKDRLRALNVPIVKLGRKRGVFVADVARLINLVTGRDACSSRPIDQPRKPQ
jgi:hypothetical protein